MPLVLNGGSKCRNSCGYEPRGFRQTKERLRLYGQVTKRIWWMPWRQQAMKDVVACDKPRGAGKQALIRGFLNGATHGFGRIPQGKLTQGTETSKYLQEKKSTEIPLVVASERGVALKYVKHSGMVWKGQS